MPERGRYQERDKYDNHRSRGRDTPHNGGHSSHDDRGYGEDRDWSREERGERGSADDRRSKQEDLSNRQRDMTTTSHQDPPAHRGNYDQGPSRVPRETASVYTSEEEYHHAPQHRQALFNLRYALTARGLCQMMEVLVNLLIVICAGVPYSNSGGYRDLASLGGLYHYYYGGANAFTGADADRVKELDRLFHQLKRPPYVFAMACGGVLMCYALLMLASGVFRVPYRCPPVLLGEAILNFLIALGYIPALAFYFIKLQETYDNAICKEREQLYKSKGHQGFECKVNGADIAEGLFGVLGVAVFAFGGVLAIRAFRFVRKLKTQRATEDSNL